MRVALRIIAGLTALCIPVGAAFILATAGTGGDISPLILPGIGFVALGLLGAVATAILGIVASAMRRQFAWLVTVIVTALLPLIGVPVVDILAGYVAPDVGTMLANTVGNALLLGGPIVVALVIFIYSFRMREPNMVGVPPSVAAPLR